MLPVLTPAEIEARQQRELRTAAARVAYDELALWVGDKPAFKLATGNMPKLWSALARKDALAEHVAVSQRAAAYAGEPADPCSREHLASLQHKALLRFDRHYRAALGAPS